MDQDLLKDLFKAPAFTRMRSLVPQEGYVPDPILDGYMESDELFRKRINESLSNQS